MAQRGRPRKAVATDVKPEGFRGPTEVLEQVTEQPQQEVEQVRPKRAISQRRKRVPVNGYRNILSVEGLDPLYHYAWINDNLVDRFLLAEYEFVDHDVVVGDRKINAASQIGSKISLPGGNGRTIFLMRQLKEYYDEDMASYHAEIDETEMAMLGMLTKDAGRYGQVSMEVTRSKNGKQVF